MVRLAGAALVLALLSPAAAQTPVDPRTRIEMPAQVRDFLLYEMRGHLEQLDKIMALVAAGDFKAASDFARTGLAVMGGGHKPGDPNPGQHVPAEFRMLGRAMHEAGEAFAQAAAAAATPPTAADYKAVVGALSTLTARCAGCHGAFRLR